jgi:hypothetical protein
MNLRLRWLSGLLAVASLGIAAVRADDARLGERGEAAPDVTTARDLTLRIATTKTEYTTGEAIQLKVTITNRGPTPVTLVQPGDGSESGWRTPIIGWSVLSADDEKARHPETMPKIGQIGRCKNRNPFSLEELLVLKPGETKTIDYEWAALPVGEGKQRVVFFYQNDPAVKWKGVSADDPALLARVKDTIPCLLRSNEISIKVKQAEK